MVLGQSHWPLFMVVSLFTLVDLGFINHLFQKSRVYKKIRLLVLSVLYYDFLRKSLFFFESKQFILSEHLCLPRRVSSPTNLQSSATKGK